MKSALPVVGGLEPAPRIGKAPLSSFGPENIVLTGANTQHHVGRFSGPIAIKAVSYGEVEWKLESQRYLIQPDTLLLLPDGGERLGNVEIAKADCVVSGYVELQVVAGGERDLLVRIQGLENEFFDESGNVTVTDYAELIGLLRTSAGARVIFSNGTISTFFSDR